MNIEEISESHRYSYVKECPCCESEQEILTQIDGFAEYYTKIYLQCQCGEYIEFVLPVN